MSGHEDEYDETEEELDEGDEELDSYQNIAYYYDLAYQKITFDLDFYREMARKAGANARILELACGAGRLSLPLLQAGFRLTGLDASTKMLEIALHKLEQERPEVQQRARFVEGDMRDLDEVLGAEQFDFIFVGLNSFQHLLSQADQLACLQQARKHLAPAGLFVVDVYNPEEKENYPADGRLEHFESVYNPERHSTVHVFLSTVAHPADQQRVYHYFYDETFPDGTIKRTVSKMTLRYIYRYELQLLLERAGFAVEELYGSYDFDEYGEGSSKLIYVCRRG